MLNHESTRKKNTKSVSSTADSIFRVQVPKERRAASKKEARFSGQPKKFRSQLTLLKVNLWFFILKPGVNIFQKNLNYSATLAEKWKTFPEQDSIFWYNNSVAHTK